MKYTFYAALFAACTFTLVACGEKKSEETPPPAPEAVQAPEPAPHELETTPEATPPAEVPNQ